MVAIDLKFDTPLYIAVGASANSRVWHNKKTTWSDIVNKIAIPTRTAETYKDFMGMSKVDQGNIKDVGGFVGGYLTGGKRDKNSVRGRQLLALDVDFSHSDFWWDFTMIYGCASLIHTTHKSNPSKPRHRLLVPLDREVSPEEYQAIARRVAGDLNIDLFDASTFDVNRLMFWPSVSSDGEYTFEYQDGAILSADSVLSRYDDWHNTDEWPTHSEITSVVMSQIKKQEDPLTKGGIVGVFCRAYDINAVIETFLSDVYDNAGPNRYSYKNGTTTGGLVVYEDKFAYSHHGTDPISGKLCNAFDLVRIHKFGDLDSNVRGDSEKAPSYKAMEAFVLKDNTVKRTIASEKFAEAKVDFANNDMVLETPTGEQEWVEQLTVNKNGEYVSSANNLNLIIRNDETLKNAFRLNVFDNKRYVVRSLPWHRLVGEEDIIKDVDYSGVRNYIECMYGITSSQKIDDALALEFERNKFHPIKNYLTSLTWDGVQRIDTLLIDYFGADDNIYTRASIRKSLCAAVARVMVPGVKFDNALILVGPQATYKSTFIKKLGKEWFSDTFTTVQGKEAFEQLQGAWIIEMAELSGLKKAEVESIKHFMSKREDSFRPAYGRTVETYKRQCVFFGTTNKDDFLRDPTGNRRFLPVDVNPINVKKSVVEDLTDYEIDQIWAEAYIKYNEGESLYLDVEENNIAIIEQNKHSENDERRGLVEEYLAKKFPENWASFDLYDRRKWLEDPLSARGTVMKDVVCVAEIWCECLCKDKVDMSRYNTREINEILRAIPEWEVVSSTRTFPIYGKQKYYKRKGTE